MCGIVGVVSTERINPDVIIALRDKLVHRGPDHAGLWTSGDSRVCFGHRRLAIVDLTPEANQPFISSDGRYVITFNGEIYNFKRLRNELLDRGVEFRTRSDTEVLVEAYRIWGDQCLDQLVGMFAFAIWDTETRRLFCARDRAGEKPFYYTVIGGSFIFASELKALVSWPGFNKQIDYTAVADYLTFGFVPDPKCIWAGCYKLPPAHSLVVAMDSDSQLAVCKPTAYWDMEFAPDYSVSDWSASILETLQAASAEMSLADVPVGAFLSGGVDSSSITAALSKSGYAVTTFTVGFNEQGYDERRWARQVSQLYKTPHVEKVVTAEDVMPVFQKLVWHYDEPFNDYSYLPTYYLCREARKLITVALSGDGGDEVFGGYHKYRRLGLRQNLQRFMPGVLTSALGAGANLLPVQTSRLSKKLLSYCADTTALMSDMLTTGLPPDQLKMAAQGSLAAALKDYSPSDTVRALLRKAPPEKVGLINSMRYLDLKLTLAGDMLVKVDRASMAVSLEVRPVYLHRNMLQLAGRIPPELLVDRHQSKKVLKTALRSWLPDSILYRPKMGFALPLSNWISTGIDQLIGRDRSPSVMGDILDSTLLNRKLQQHAQGNPDAIRVIHSLFFLEHWLNMWN